MNLVPWSAADDFFPSLPSVIEDFFGRDTLQRPSASRLTLPAVNVKEEDDKFLISLAIPGIKKEECTVNIENGMLTVSATRKEEKKDDKGKYSRYEYSASSFARSFSLPPNADPESVSAKYEDGELVITVDKKEKSSPTQRKIEVQ